MNSNVKEGYIINDKLMTGYIQSLKNRPPLAVGPEDFIVYKSGPTILDVGRYYSDTSFHKNCPAKSDPYK